jgi:hypothetical protein
MTDAEVRWFFRRPEVGRVEFRVGRAGDDVIAEWVGYATLQASLRSRASTFVTSDGVDAEVARTALGPKIDALMRSLRGEITLHASCVTCGGVAVAFLGDSMAGKSTIAALLCRDERVALIADDLVALSFIGGRVLALPSETEHALRPDGARALGMEPTEAAAKVRRSALRLEMNPTPLGALVSLAFDPAAQSPSLGRVRGADAFVTLSAATTRFVFDEPSLLRAELDTLGRMSAEVPMYNLRRARLATNMEHSAQEALRLLSSLPPTSR